MPDAARARLRSVSVPSGAAVWLGSVYTLARLSRRCSTRVDQEVSMTRAALRSLMLLLIGFVTVLTPALPFAQTFQAQTRLGASLPGDTWEPAIAADRYGHVYVLIPDFPPSCKGCPQFDRRSRGVERQRQNLVLLIIAPAPAQSPLPSEEMLHEVRDEINSTTGSSPADVASRRACPAKSRGQSQRQSS